MDISYRHFSKGDLGELSQIQFEKEEKIGTIEFWSSGYVGIHLVNTQTGDELINTLIKPGENEIVNKTLLDVFARLT